MGYDSYHANKRLKVCKNATFFKNFLHMRENGFPMGVHNEHVHNQVFMTKIILLRANSMEGKLFRYKCNLINRNKSYRNMFFVSSSSFRVMSNHSKKSADRANNEAMASG